MYGVAALTLTAGLNPSARLGDNPSSRMDPTRPPSAPRQPIAVCDGLPDAYTANGTGCDSVAILGTANANGALAQRLEPALGGRPVNPRPRRTRRVATRRRKAPLAYEMGHHGGRDPLLSDCTSTAECMPLGSFGTSAEIGP